MPFGVEYVDESVSRSGDVVVLVGVLHRVGHVERSIDIADAEGREARGDRRIGERAVEGRKREVTVENVDGTRLEVGGEEEVAGSVAPKREALVDGRRRLVSLKDRLGRINVAVPAGDRAVLGGEDEASRVRAVEQEVVCAVEDVARGRG